MKKQIEQLFTKEMTRREFMFTLGLGLVSMLGFSSVLKMMVDGGFGATNRPASQVKTVGYGASTYGK